MAIQNKLFYQSPVEGFLPVSIMVQTIMAIRICMVIGILKKLQLQQLDMFMVVLYQTMQLLGQPELLKHMLDQA